MREKIKLSGVPETMLQTVYARAKESSGRGAMRSKWARNTASAMNGTLQTQSFTSRTCSTRNCWPVIRSAGCSW